ncbi:MAG TPA: diguanylate cyclase, partial [Anaerolineae bacterium]
MAEQPIQVLMIEDSRVAAALIRRLLQEVNAVSFNITHVERLTEGLEHLAAKAVDVVLLDLTLPDSSGLDTLKRVRDHAPEMPIVVLTGFEDETLAVQAVQAGAQDYLVKGQVDAHLLMRALRYAIERQRLQAELGALSLRDSLTGLVNRRGFMTLAEQALKMAHRTQRGMFLLFGDLDGLKSINDTLGHAKGDAALGETAAILKESFRESDILARLGGDEFAVLAVESAEDSAGILSTRLRKNLAAHNACANRPFHLSLSVGITRYDPAAPCSIDNLMAGADKLMYEQKKQKSKA